MKPQFLRIEFSASRVFVVVAVNLSVAFEADRNRVFDIVLPTAGDRVDMIGLDLYSSKPMADAATPVATDQQFGNLISLKGHGRAFLRPAIISLRTNLVPWAPHFASAHVPPPSRQDAPGAVAGTSMDVSRRRLLDSA